MSLNKAIESGKEHRKKYRHSKSVSKNCRNHGNCKYCKNNRLYQLNKEKEKIENKLQELEE